MSRGQSIIAWLSIAVILRVLIVLTMWAVDTSEAKAAPAPRWGAQVMVAREIFRLAEEANVPTGLALRVAWEESNFVPGLRGGLGERGPMQVNPAARPEIVYMPWYQQAAVGIGLLRYWLVRCDRDEMCAVRSYRAGHLVNVGF